MKSYIYKYHIFFYFILIPFSLLGQNTLKNRPKDTSKVQFIKIGYKDSLYINNQIKSDHFYDSLITRASRNKISKTALSLLLVNNPIPGNYIGIENIDNEQYYRLYAGKKIRKIEIIKIDVFGPSLRDTSEIATTWIEKFGNKTHINTRKHIIKNNILFGPGDEIDPVLLADNERLIRKLDFIKDAYIQIAEVPDSEDQVDVLVLTKDVYSAGVNLEIMNSNSAAIEVYENNLAGIGHKLYGVLYTNSQESPPTGYEFNYKIENIGGSFIKTNLHYLKAFETEKIGINFNRNFFSYNTKWAGGLSLYQTSTLEDIKKPDTVLIDVRLNYSSQDLWLGRSILLKTNNWQYQNRTRLVFAARYINNTFYRGPDVRERYNFQYHDNRVALTSISYSRQKYFKSNLIYGFGKTEDIPIGSLIQVTTGFENDEFFNRLYFGFTLSQGSYYPKIGYISFQGQFGGSYYQKNLEQGVVKLRGQAISNLHSFNNLKFREFLGVSYARGINRFSDEKIYIESGDIWGLSSDYLFGLQKVSFRSELVAYTKLHLYNFKFLVFGFADLGLIGPENKSLFTNKLYSGVGLGIRIRNENLVFKTFQLRFALYPVVPDDVSHFYFLISGENYNKHRNFEPTAPKKIEYN